MTTIFAEIPGLSRSKLLITEIITDLKLMQSASIGATERGINKENAAVVVKKSDSLFQNQSIINQDFSDLFAQPMLLVKLIDCCNYLLGVSGMESINHAVLSPIDDSTILRVGFFCLSNIELYAGDREVDCLIKSYVRLLIDVLGSDYSRVNCIYSLHPLQNTYALIFIGFN